MSADTFADPWAETASVATAVAVEFGNSGAGATVDPELTRDVLAHLDAQTGSARRLQAVVVEQGAAIRRRSTQQVVKLAAQMQAEIHRRETIEIERQAILERASGQLGVPASEVNIALLCSLMTPENAEQVRFKAENLRTVLNEVEREHSTNQALMRQELSFLDHLLRLAGTGAYSAQGRKTQNRQSGGAMRRSVIELDA